MFNFFSLSPLLLRHIFRPPLQSLFYCCILRLNISLCISNKFMGYCWVLSDQISRIRTSNCEDQRSDSNRRLVGNGESVPNIIACKNANQVAQVIRLAIVFTAEQVDCMVFAEFLFRFYSASDGSNVRWRPNSLANLFE
jgi:hypothetical protein